MENMDTKALAEYLDVSERTIEQWRLVGSDGPPYLKIGRLCRYRKSDVDAWLESRLRTSTSDRGPVTA